MVEDERCVRRPKQTPGVPEDADECTTATGSAPGAGRAGSHASLAPAFPPGEGGGEGEGEDERECIPGVPEDVVLEILARTPHSADFNFRHVSRAWRRAVASDALRASRRAAGHVEQWLFVLPEFPRGGPFRALDPLGGRWHTLPPLPACTSTSSASTSPSPSSPPGPSPSMSPMSTPGSSPSSSPPFHDFPPLEGFACAAVAGKLLVIGGVERTPTPDGGSKKSVTSAVWQFDPASWTWSPAPPLGTARSWGAASVLEDQYVFISGGQGARSFLKSAEVFDAVEGVWRPIASMNAARCSHRCAAVDGRILVIAGELERHDLPPQQARAPLPPAMAAIAFSTLSAPLL